MTLSEVYSYSGCRSEDLKGTVYRTWNNRFYTPNGQFLLKCGARTFDLAQYQEAGYDRGSTVATLPDFSAIVAAARAVLQM